MKALGKKPPCKHNGCAGQMGKPCVNYDHYRQALLEAAEELSRGGKSCGGKGDVCCWLCKLAKKLRVSAGEVKP